MSSSDAALNETAFASRQLGRSSQFIVGRLLRFWDSKNIKKQGEFMGVTLLLLDEKDSVIHGFIPAVRVGYYRPSLRTAAVLKVSKFEVAKCSNTYKITEHPFLIRFIPQTTIVEVSENVPIIKLEKFMLRTFSQLHDLANTNLDIPDVVGQIQSVQGSDFSSWYLTWLTLFFYSGKTIELDDVTFHQCVNLTRFNSEKTVSFVPPDGEFELMKYRITEGVNLPFRVLPTIKELGRTRMEVNVKVKSVFGAKMFALGVVVKIPVPKQTAKTNFQVTSGRAKYNPSIDCLVWKIRKFPGQTESTLSAEIELISTMGEKKSWTRPPIQMEFQVPMFTASGLRVCFLKVWEKSGYNTVEWVRYITKAGSYEIRC